MYYIPGKSTKGGSTMQEADEQKAQGDNMETKDMSRR